MALDEANARLTLLIDEELDPARRARLIAVQLALGFPHALEVSPERLAELREEQVRPQRWVAQSWLAGASAVATLWCGAVSVLLGQFRHLTADAVLPLTAFLIGLLHAVYGLYQTWARPKPGGLTLLAWASLLAPLFIVLESVIGSPAAGVGAMFCASPSLLVAFTAARLKRTYE